MYLKLLSLFKWRHLFLVSEPSLPPQNVTAVSTGPHNISVSWSPAHEATPVLGYDIFCKRLYDNFTSHLRSTSLKPQVNVTGLQFATWYQVTVRAYNSKGSGPNSSYANVRTQNKGKSILVNKKNSEAFHFFRFVHRLYFLSFFTETFVQITPRPQNLTVTAKNSTSVTVEWLPVSRHLVSLPPYNYSVQWAAVKEGTLGVITNVTVTTTSYKILGLAPYTNYVIQVAARDWNHTGNFSDPLCVHTLEGGKCN